jgi:hypothetical protein
LNLNPGGDQLALEQEKDGIQKLSHLGGHWPGLLLVELQRLGSYMRGPLNLLLGLRAYSQASFRLSAWRTR